MSMVWADPEAFWALLPALAWFGLCWRRDRASPPAAAQLRHPSLGSSVVDSARLHRDRRHRLAWALQALAIVLAVAALARPQQIGAWVPAPPVGRDIALVVDTSLTMSLEDFRQRGRSVSRMAMLQAVLGDFMRRREADRFALAVFGSAAATLTPPTFDRDHVVAQLQRLQVGALGNDTAMGDALGLALAPLRAGALPPVIVLVSDGEPSNAGDMTPAEAVAVARRLGVAIHTLQVGAPSAPLATPEAMAARATEAPQPGLSDIARLTGGRHWLARSTEAVRDVMRDIDRLAATLQTAPSDRERREWFVLPLAAALLAFALGHALSWASRR